MDENPSKTYTEKNYSNYTISLTIVIYYTSQYNHIMHNLISIIIMLQLQLTMQQQNIKFLNDRKNALITIYKDIVDC